jgi:hypothetical protein
MGSNVSTDVGMQHRLLTKLQPHTVRRRWRDGGVGASGE